MSVWEIGFLKLWESFFKNTYEGVYFSVESKEYITGKGCNRLHKTSYKLTINWNILFARNLLQDSGTSYGKLHGASKVIKKWRPHQQVFLNGFVQNVSNA